jgi:hypothetical protein
VRALALAVLLALPLPAAAACRLALALALDVSGSVDQTEYVLQMNGVAEALGDAEVQAALFAMPDVPVAMAIFEWSSSSYQRVIQDWVLLSTPADIDALRARLLGWSRQVAPEATGLGAALEFGAGLMRRGPACWDQTLDVSGDGKNNDWPIPQRLRNEGRLGTMTVNALVVAREFLSTEDMTPNGVAELSAYFQARIIHGPAAFVEVALGYEDYADAMRRKLLRELSTMPLGQVLPDAGIRWVMIDAAQ